MHVGMKSSNPRLQALNVISDVNSVFRGISRVFLCRSPEPLLKLNCLLLHAAELIVAGGEPLSKGRYPGRGDGRWVM